MRFYVPEWDDAVDARYDFVHDELSTLHKSERDRHFIWDVFDEATLPIDGVLISREQVEGSSTKADRLTDHGVYDDPELSIPEWLPTVSDCGAWGYKQLPFPPYSNEGMLEFYESMDVDVGVTIDHLVLGSGKEQGRLYLDERAFGDAFGTADLPDRLTDQVDVMVDEWPATWPGFVESEEPSIVTDRTDPRPFGQADFQGTVGDIIDRLREDPRAVYRRDDVQDRYELTLDNAEEMRELYETGDWSFRLMAAFQGWDPESYGEAVSEILEMGYDYVGIGGVAGSPESQVTDIVAEVGKTVTYYERQFDRRIDAHVFGFAKADAFDTVGRSGMTSFDSASMLRAAWTGGKNYHLSSDERYDAIRVRYPQHGDSLEESIEKALRGQEVLHALRAYDDGASISSRIEQWYDRAERALEALPDYLLEHRHDECFDQSRIRDVRSEFREQFNHGRVLFASFGQDFRRALVGLLRDDDPQSFVPFEKYEDAISSARSVFESLDRISPEVAELEANPQRQPFDHVCHVVEDYATWNLIDDEELVREYRRTLKAKPWEQCDCPICEEHGIEIAIFRGNNRNRRRGFHNTRRFYEQFERALPKIFAVVPAGSDLFGCSSVEAYLRREHEPFWNAVHDLPVVEIGVCDANGIHEWWESGPSSLSLDPNGMDDVLEQAAARYETIYVFDETDSYRSNQNLETVSTVADPDELRSQILSQLGYSEPYLPGESQVHLKEF